MHNLLEYSENHSMTSGRLWNYYRDRVNDSATEIVANLRLNNNQATASKSFEYMTKTSTAALDPQHLKVKIAE